MARRNEAGRYLLEGLTPQQISDRMGISLGSIRQYLCTLVGEGELLFSDIAFAIAERQLIEDVIRRGDLPVAPFGPHKNLRMAGYVRNILFKQGHNILHDLIELYLITSDPRPDLYALICESEIILHRFVKRTLVSTFEDRWWREGIPEQIRKNCQIRKEEDLTPLEDPYYYTTFIDLKLIIDKNWRSFSAVLPKALSTNKQDTLENLQRVNSIRNRVMHPVKIMSEYGDDHRFARKFLADLREIASRSE
jgi:hypothetical protein